MARRSLVRPRRTQLSHRGVAAARRNGDCDAQYRYGTLFHLGYGVEKDDETALEWWHKAADQGHGIAQVTLAAVYLHEMVPAGTEKNKAWISCVRGCGRDKDYLKAYKWARLSRGHAVYSNQRKMSEFFINAIEGNFDALLEINPEIRSETVEELETGRTVSFEEWVNMIALTPDELAQAERQITEWKPSPSLCDQRKAF